jgi:hypothetical protein
LCWVFSRKGLLNFLPKLDLEFPDSWVACAAPSTPTPHLPTPFCGWCSVEAPDAEMQARKITHPSTLVLSAFQLWFWFISRGAKPAGKDPGK